MLPDADTSSAKSVVDEDENTSSISDAQTIETRDSCNDTEDIDPETRLKPQGTAANDPLAVEVCKDFFFSESIVMHSLFRATFFCFLVLKTHMSSSDVCSKMLCFFNDGQVAEDADTSSSPVLASKIEEAEEHSCSSLVTDQVFDPIKQAPENKSSSAISRENIGGSTLRPLVSETREKVRETANATNEDGEILKDQDIVIASEPFTTESLLEMCDEPDEGRETPCDERSKRSHPEAVKTVVKDELIKNLLTEARKKAESKALLNPGSVLIKKRESKSNSSDNKGMNTSFIRTTKQKVGGEAGEINIDPVKDSTKSTPKTIRGSSVPTQHTDSTLDSIDGISQRGGETVSDSVISISDLKNKTGKELRSIAKELKITHYYKLKKEDLLQRLIRQLTDCTKQRMES